MKTGQADLPLHYGKAPRWLFDRMVKLAKPISQLIIDEYSQDEFLRRMADPYFFQALGCVLGFDWHSSGLTTTLTGALKLALKDTGIEIAGGKGKTSKKAPNEIEKIGDKFGLHDGQIKKLIYASKMSAKVDNNLIQDGYQLYHHAFFISEKGKWAVVQQGLQENGKFARRYHWLSDNVKNFVQEPETGIAAERYEKKVLNLVAKESLETQKTSVDLIKENPYRLKKYEKIKQTLQPGQTNLLEFSQLRLPSRHEILKIDLGNFKALEKAYETGIEDYEELVAFEGIGAKTLRALALISNLVYGSSLSWKDPAKFSFAHGGKDGVPFPVDKALYDRNIKLIEDAIEGSRLGLKNKLDCLRRLKILVSS